MAGSSFGGTVKLKGESEYQKSLREITSNLTVLSSEMKVITSQYEKNDKSVINLSQPNDVLIKKINEQKSKVEPLTRTRHAAGQFFAVHFLHRLDLEEAGAGKIRSDDVLRQLAVGTGCRAERGLNRLAEDEYQDILSAKSSLS